MALPIVMAVGAMVLLAVGIAYELLKLGRPRG
jgi:hypothetical protein